MKTDNTKLDIEGIRERHEAVDTLAYMSDFDLNVNLRDACIDRGKLLTEADRLQSELMTARRHMIQAAAKCARQQGGMWDSDEYPFSKAGLRANLKQSAQFVSNLATWLKDKGVGDE